MSFLIKVENENGGGSVLITDDHFSHIKGHLRVLYKLSMLKHIIQHFKLWVLRKKLNLPIIEIK
jgi:hypothetical protein